MREGLGWLLAPKALPDSPLRMVVLQSGYFPLVFCFSSSSFNVYFDNSFYFLPLNPCGHVAPVQEPRVSGFSLASAPFDSAKSDLTA